MLSKSSSSPPLDDARGALAAEAEAPTPALLLLLPYWSPAAVAGGAAALRRVTLASTTPLSKLGTSALSSVTSIQTTAPPLPASRRVLKRKW